MILDGLTVAGHHLAGVRRHIKIHVRLRPAGVIQQLWHEIPVGIEILVVVATALYGTESITDMFGIGREITSLLLKIIRFEGDRAVVEVGIVEQHATTVDIHRVCPVGMALNEPLSHVRGHLYTVQDAIHTQRCLVENLHGTAYCLLVHCLAGLIEQEAEGQIEDDGSKEHHP